MNVSEMRNRIAAVYDGPSWKAKVSRMPEDQVIAIYHSFLKKGKFNAVKRPNDGYNYHQYTIFEYANIDKQKENKND